MTKQVFSYPWLDDLIGDTEVAALWSAESQLGHIIAFERAWTDGLETLGRISPKEAQEARARLSAYVPEPSVLSSAAARDGVVIPEIIRQLRSGMEEPAAIHSGATSQDVVDTAIVLTLRDLSEILDSRLAALLDALSELRTRFGNQKMMGRTRMQAAVPILVAGRIRAWRDPLIAQHARLGERRQNFERLQFGGATGNRAELGEDAASLAAHLGSALDLRVPEGSWHTDRTAIADFAGWMTLTTAALGKMGFDLCLMAQQGIDEVRISGGGGSSAMPHKQNPVKAELLVTLSRLATGMNSTMQTAVLHEQERSGMAWVTEWIALPQLSLVTGRALSCALELVLAIEAMGAEARHGQQD